MREERVEARRGRLASRLGMGGVTMMMIGMGCNIMAGVSMLRYAVKEMLVPTHFVIRC